MDDNNGVTDENDKLVEIGGMNMGSIQKKKKSKAVIIALVIIALLILLGLAVIIFSVIAYFVAKEINGPKPWSNIRLPSTMYPLTYDLFISTDLAPNFNFSGNIDIQLQVVEKTKYVILHSVGLNTSAIEIQSLAADSEKYTVEDTMFYEPNEFLVITLDRELETGLYSLSMDFSGILGTNLYGYYRSQYTAGNQTQWLATTHFEPTDARRAFPCFDEPAMKANFTITLEADQQYTLLSNMMDANTTINGNRKTVNFMTSVKMSTYLVAYVISDFESVNTTTPDGKLVRVWTQPGKSSQGLFAVDRGAKMISFYESYFGQVYPLPKQDMIAIPDFAAGAMENWGLITYRETALLVDPDRSSTSDIQRVAVVVAHELAHQWFGNLATMEWWSDLWLNEGFASYVEYLGVNFTDPDWEMPNQFIMDSYVIALAADSLSSSHPIAQHVENPSQIQQMFDAISYDKGSSILRMLSAFVGNDLFVSGLQHYLNEYKYANAKTSDLWDSISIAAGDDIAPMMNTWTNYVGYPIITLTNPTPTTIVATQSRFFSVPPEQEVNDTLYWVPLDYYTQSNPQVVSVPLPQTAAAQNTINYNPNEFIKFNVGQTGFYRVLYTTQMIDNIANALLENSNALSVADRAGLIEDLYSFQQAGIIDPTLALEYSDYLVNETDYIVWSIVLSKWGTLAKVLDMQPCYGKFESFVKGLINNQIITLGWNISTTDKHITKLLRSSILNAAVAYGQKEVIQQATTLYAQFSQNPTLYPLNPDLRLSVYRAVVGNGAYNEWKDMLNRYQTADFAAERNRCLLGLASTQKPYLIEATLQLILNGQVRTQDMGTLLSAVGSNPYGREYAWQFVKANYAKIYEIFGSGSFTLGSIISGITQFSDEYHLNDIKAFFEANPSPSADSAIAMSLEKIQVRVDWLSKYGNEVCSFLNNI